MNAAHLQERLLDIGLEHYDGFFADDQPANNKLDLGYERVSQHSEVCDEVLYRMYHIARKHRYNPDFIVGVPNGAIGYAARLAAMLEVDYNPHLRKDPNTKKLYYANDIDKDSVSRLQRGILVEDVLNRRSSTRRALRLPGLGPKTTAVIAVFDRGIPEERYAIDKPVHAVVARPIPAELPQIHALWQHAS